MHDNDIDIYSTHNDGKSVVAERFIRILKNKTHKYLTLISKNVYIDKLDDIVNKYNNTYHRSIKVKPIGAKPGACIYFDVKDNDEDPKFEVGDHVRISKHKNMFSKYYTPNRSGKVFIIRKVKNNIPLTNFLVILTVKKLVEHIVEKSCEIQIK